MSPSMPLSKSISFKTERFDYSSDLPLEANAGNRFYGRDVAAYLCEQLTSQGIAANFLDEDWGWLVEGSVAHGAEYEIATYNVNEHGEGARPGAPEWGLWIRAFGRTKRWSVFPWRREVQVPDTLVKAVSDAITAIGAEPTDWANGPGT
jgi:hypothetical protein